MRQKGIKLIAVIFLLQSIVRLQAQESVNTTNGNATGTGGSASFSVGEIMYQTLTGTNGSVTQGGQQPFEISIITDVDDYVDWIISVSAYPNPFVDYLVLNVGFVDFKGVSYQMYDVNGKLIAHRSINETQSKINTGNYLPGLYTLKILQGNRVIVIYKIIKNKR